MSRFFFEVEQSVTKKNYNKDMIKFPNCVSTKAHGIIPKNVVKRKVLYLTPNIPAATFTDQ